MLNFVSVIKMSVQKSCNFLSLRGRKILLPQLTYYKSRDYANKIIHQRLKNRKDNFEVCTYCIRNALIFKRGVQGRDLN